MAAAAAPRHDEAAAAGDAPSPPAGAGVLPPAEPRTEVSCAVLREGPSRQTQLHERGLTLHTHGFKNRQNLGRYGSYFDVVVGTVRYALASMNEQANKKVCNARARIRTSPRSICLGCVLQVQVNRRGKDGSAWLTSEREPGGVEAWEVGRVGSGRPWLVAVPDRRIPTVQGKIVIKIPWRRRSVPAVGCTCSVTLPSGALNTE